MKKAEQNELDWDVFRRRLRGLRGDRDLEQITLSQLCGLYDKAVFDYENGRRKPSVETAIRISDFFGVSLEYLIGREENHLR